MFFEPHYHTQFYFNETHKARNLYKGNWSTHGYIIGLTIKKTLQKKATGPEHNRPFPKKVNGLD